MGRALLLVGSPRAESTSRSVGGYLLEKLKQRGWETETLRVEAAPESSGCWRELLESVKKADVVVLAFPLYVDSLPANLIRALERLARERNDRSGGRPQRFLAIVNSGFPESCQLQTAVAICRRFAREAGFQWAGGIIIGFGGAINGKPLEDLGKMVHHVRQGLEQTAALLDSGGQLSETMDLSIWGPLPKRLIVPVANLVWWFLARRHGAHRRLKARPYWEGQNPDIFERMP